MFVIYSLASLSLVVAVACDLRALVAGKVLQPTSGAVSHYDSTTESIFIMGGYVGPLSYTSDILRFNIISREVRKVGNLPNKLSTGYAGSDRYKNFYYLGGYAYSWPLEVLQMTIKHPTPVLTGHIPIGRYGCSVFDGLDHTYIAGGIVDKDGATDDVVKDIIKYNTVNHTYSIVGEIPKVAGGISCTWHKKSMYIFGGEKSDSSNTILKFTPDDDTIEVLSEEIDNQYGVAVSNGERIFIVGGKTSGDEPNYVTEFDPDTGYIGTHNLTGFNVPFWDHTAVYVPYSSRIYVIGGTTASSKLLDRIFYIQLD